MKKFAMALPVAALLAACGGGGSQGGGGAAGQLKAVGSSTVYPFTKAVAEEFQRAGSGATMIVESTGTGAGIKLFCSGVGSEFPDVVNASDEEERVRGVPASRRQAGHRAAGRN
jgi:phosphate transport system substrate-binding protein